MTTRDALEGVLESEGYGVTRALTLFYAVMLLLSHYSMLLCCCITWSPDRGARIGAGKYISPIMAAIKSQHCLERVTLTGPLGGLDWTGLGLTNQSEALV